MNAVVAIMMIVMGVGIAGIWTRDIVIGDRVDLSGGLFAARDTAAGTLLWPHWFAEYATAALLIGGGIGLLLDTGWDVVVAAVAAGALLYTSTNSLGWAFAERDRHAYAYPMLAGIAVGALVFVHLLMT